MASYVLTDPGAHAGETWHLTGPAALSYAQVAEALAAALGQPVRYVNVSPAPARASMLQAGFPEWIADFINALRDMESRDLASAVSPDVETVTGPPATLYLESLRAVLH